MNVTTTNNWRKKGNDLSRCHLDYNRMDRRGIIKDFFFLNWFLLQRKNNNWEDVVYFTMIGIIFHAPLMKVYIKNPFPARIQIFHFKFQYIANFLCLLCFTMKSKYIFLNSKTAYTPDSIRIWTISSWIHIQTMSSWI